MRTIGGSILALTVAFALVSLADGQQPGGGRFGGGAGGVTDPVMLLRNPSVKKELDVKDEQMEKLPAAMNKALAEVLNPKQLKRLREIELQQRGSQAFLDAGVQKELKISDEQVKNIKTIIDDSRKEIAEAFKDAKGGGFQGIREKMTALRKETTEKVNGVLNSDQKKAYKQMLGEEFKIEFQGFGGGEFKKGKKKKDNSDL